MGLERHRRRQRDRARTVALARALAAMLGALALSSCGGPRDPEPVLIMVASSVGNAVEEIASAYERETGEVVRVSAGPSNALAHQAIAGAPADLFLSASEDWGRAVMDDGAGEEMIGLLGNRLVLVVPRANPARLRVPHDLAQPRVERIAIAGEAVPAGEYAEQALGAIGMWPVVRGRIVRAESVRFTLAFVERAEVEAGIVYATDASASGGVDVIYDFEPGTHDEIVYPLVRLTERGRGLFEFMRSDAARAIFEDHGFSVRGTP